MNESLEDLHAAHDYETITERFESYLGRYKEIFNPRSSTKKVIGIARNANDIARTLRYLTHTGSADEVHQMRCSVIDVFGSEELYQVIYLAFIETLAKFDRSRGVPLEKFIYNYYPYLLTAEVNKLAGPRQILNDPKLFSSYEPDEDSVSGNMKDFLNLTTIELDEKWIEGSDCGEPFVVLTPLERKLLVMIFVENKTQEEIARDMRYHFSSIKRKKNEIMDKLKKRLEETANGSD